MFKGVHACMMSIHTWIQTITHILWLDEVQGLNAFKISADTQELAWISNVGILLKIVCMILVCMYIHASTQILCACMCVCEYKCVCVYIYIHTHTRTYIHYRYNVHVFIYTCTHLLHVRAYVDIMYVCTFIYIYIYTHSDTRQNMILKSVRYGIGEYRSTVPKTHAYIH